MTPPPPHRESFRLNAAAILDQVHDAVISTDLSGVIQTWNAAATRIYGWTASEAIGRHVGFMYPEEDLPLLHADVIAPLHQHGTHEVVVRNLHRSGREIFVTLRLSFQTDEQGRRVGMIGCSNDITDAKQSTEALRLERDFSERLIDTTRSIVLVLDLEGRIVRFNRFMEELSGWTLEEVRGRDWFETFLPSEERPAIQDVFQKAILGKKTHGKVNAILIRDGSERQISWWDAPLTDLDGRVRWLLSVGHDVTELIESQRQVLLSQRLATIGETMTTIAHETRNELDALGLGLRLLADDGLDPVAEKRVAGLRASHARLEQTFEQLRDFAAPIRLRRAPHDLSETWRRAWASLAHRHRGATLGERLETKDLLCQIDALRMEQVFRNLFENSLAAGADGAHIEIHTADTEEAGHPWIRIVVGDDGPGLDPKAVPKLFDPFFTTKKRGTGLGLALVRRIVELHGGRIHVGDPVGPGAELVILLPARIGSDYMMGDTGDTGGSENEVEGRRAVDPMLRT